jgi:hypothetical protein
MHLYSQRRRTHTVHTQFENARALALDDQFDDQFDDGV